MNYNDIPLPQDVRLYQVANNAVIEPKLSLLSISDNGDNNTYMNLQNKQFLFTITNQNALELSMSFDDKNVSSIRNSTYYSLNGFDRGFDYRFLNYNSPTVCFFPLVSATDKSTNVTLTAIGSNYYQIASYTSVLSNTLNLNDLVLLKNQTTNSENKIYRVTTITGINLTVYDDSSDTASVNSLLTQNQSYIFTRVKVSDQYGDSFYGLYNTSGYFWVSQTANLKLTSADYGITLSSELSENKLNASLFSSVSLELNQVVAVNVLTDGAGSLGGKTSGLYLITKIANGFVYIQPIYPDYVFIHQFFEVGYDLTTLSSNVIWYVNPATVTSSNYLYSSVFFNFLTLNISSVTNTPSLWARQVGAASDTVLGVTIYTRLVNNNYLRNSDIFSMAIKPPTWTENVVEGLSLSLSYNTNMLAVQDQAVIQ
jgi:hypothetical protein